FSPFFNTFAAPFGETLKLRSDMADLFAEMSEDRSKLRVVYKIMPRHEVTFIATHTKGRPSALGISYQGQAFSAPDWVELGEKTKTASGGFPSEILVLIRQVAGDENYKDRYELYGM
ncbi:MAG: hypothetical protein DI585_03250, partial [Pseudomonas fluorescens]